MPIHKLGQNPHIYTISPAQVQAAITLPDFLQLSMVCMTLSHQMNRTRDGARCDMLMEPFYQYRGNAIRSLNSEINVEHKRTADIVIAGIMMLLLIDVSHFSSKQMENQRQSLLSHIFEKRPNKAPCRIGNVTFRVFKEYSCCAAEFVHWQGQKH